LCLPPELRGTVGYDEALLTGGFNALAQAIFEYQRWTAEELFHISRDCIYPGGILVNHRSSGTLEANHHFHGIFTDGVFVEVEPGQLEFRRLPAPTASDIAGIAYQACLAFCKVLKARGFWETKSVGADTVEGILSLPGAAPRVSKFFGEAARDAEGGLAPRDGAYAFHLFLGNAIEVEEYPQLVHLVNYLLSPPFKDSQLEVLESGSIVLHLRRRRHDGTGDVELTKFEFLDRVADLIPRRFTNTVRYYGIYAPAARLRRQAIRLRSHDGRAPTQVKAGWTRCPVCSATMRVVRGFKSSRRTAATIAPDTPDTAAGAGQDRSRISTSDEGQGRLFG
jgi:hypothetical protein